MPISLAMRRLLRIRELEEEQSRIALETALGEMNRLKAALLRTAQHGQAARRLFASSVQSGDVTDRVACLQEMRAADNLTEVLSGKLATAAPEVARLRERFLATRVQRKQAESIIKESDSRAEIEEERRNQRDLDDLSRARTKHKNEDRG
jgi:flagellar export protein FliJ